MNYDGSHPAGGHGFQAHGGPMRSQGRGEITLKSADPKAAPRIFFNYLSQEADRQEFRAAVRLTREVFAQKAFDPYRGAELAPGPEVQTDAEIDAFVRAHVESAYHPSCSCRMGTDSMAVVAGQARVNGLESLRLVADQVMPLNARGHRNPPNTLPDETPRDRTD